MADMVRGKYGFVIYDVICRSLMRRFLYIHRAKAELQRHVESNTMRRRSVSLF